ncbi:hypothetical protein TL16_g06968 [Triparma laevis f. inornata]|uniref:Uncharacterized protein n=1 Tax=Triparma laevis f. inornata TaxID=1714386 RepID=A0A9W7AU83_9STRA|nr:hypothetical protein TL16_g06968 [Triparma laevis f. inornata]
MRSFIPQLSTNDDAYEALSRAELIAALKQPRSSFKPEHSYSIAPSKSAALTRSTPGVVKISETPDMLSTNTMIKTVSLLIHEEPQILLSLLLSSYNTDTLLNQKVLQSTPDFTISYWSFIVDGKLCDMLLKLTPTTTLQETTLNVESIADDAYDLPPTHSKTIRLLLNKGSIYFRSSEFKLTSLTFTAQLGLGENSNEEGMDRFRSHTRLTMSEKFSLSVSNLSENHDSTSKEYGKKNGKKNRNQSSTKYNRYNLFGEGVKSDTLFLKVCSLFYERFKKENEVDRRRKDDFIERIGEAKKHSDEELELLKKSTTLVDEFSRGANRIAETVTDSVEKFVHHREGEDGNDGNDGGAAWGISIATIDCSAIDLFAELWITNTYAKQNEDKTIAIREIWENVDNTRAQQFIRSISLPGGLKDRLFEVWMTWDARTEADGRHTFIVAISPLSEYKGKTKPMVPGTEKMVRALTRGVYFIKELTKSTCQWTRAQQVDLKVSMMSTGMMDYFAKQHLGWANVLQKKYRRNGNEVDRENSCAIIKMMREMKGLPLRADQTEMFQRCINLYGDGGEQGWTAVDRVKKCPDIKMWLKYFPPQKGERQIATGKSIGICDCKAEDFAALAWDYCSRNRVRISKEAKNPARLMLRKSGVAPNEATMATIKRFPFFLANREFVAKQVWKTEENLVYIVYESIDDEVDYGVNMKTVRGSTRGFYRIEDLPDVGGVKQCRVTFIIQADAGGIVPAYLVDQKIPAQLSIVQKGINAFRQDDQIDDAARLELSALMRDKWQQEVYSFEELLALSNGMGFVNQVESISDLKQLGSDDKQVSVKITHVENDRLVTGVFEAVVDGGVEDIAVWEYLKMTRKQMRINRGKIDIKIKKENNHSQLYSQVRKFNIPGLKPREWRSRVIWKHEKTSCFVVYMDSDGLDEEYPRNPTNVAASALTCWKYDKLDDIEGVPQTKVMMVSRIDISRGVPTFAMNSLAKSFSKGMTRMRKNFDQSQKIDEVRRARISLMFEQLGGGNASSHSVSDKKAIAQSIAQFENLYVERVNSETPSSHFGMADSHVLLNDEGGGGWGRTSVKVRARMEEVAAFFWDYGSRANMHISGDVERAFEVEEEEEEEEGELTVKNGKLRKVVRRSLQLDSSVYLFVSEMALVKADDKTMILLVTPFKERSGVDRKKMTVVNSLGSVSINKAPVNASNTVAIRLRRLGVKTTKVDYTCEINIASDRKVVVERRLDEIAKVSIYFHRLLPLCEYEAVDGKALGHDLLWKVATSKKRFERLKEVGEKSRGMKEILEIFPWFNFMMVTVFEGYLHLNRVVDTKLCCVSDAEATQIGKNLLPALKSKKLAEAGVDQWRVQNRAVKELMENHTWFEPMVVVLGKGIVKAAAWGLMWRVSIGAILSTTDLITDLLVLKQFSDGGEETLLFRNLTAFSLVSSIALQLFLVVVQTRKKRWKHQLKEILIVLFCLKAPWDAYKVAIGSEHEKDLKFDPMMEMTMDKCIETFAESIPGILIQLSAILKTIETGGSGAVSTMASVSFMVSCLTTGFVSATISYDWDTDPQKRATNPGFYGYVPDSPIKRSTLFFTLIGLSSSLVFLKSLLVVALGFISKSYSLIYIGGDVLLFLGLKAARSDLYYWIPLTGGIKWFVAVLLRVIIKFIVDFTGCVQYRHPQEAGGMYFSVNLFTPLIGLVILLFVWGDSTNPSYYGFKEPTVRFMKDWTIIIGGFMIACMIR